MPNFAKLMLEMAKPQNARFEVPNLQFSPFLGPVRALTLLPFDGPEHECTSNCFACPYLFFSKVHVHLN
jgi:hypothetical protein